MGALMRRVQNAQQANPLAPAQPQQPASMPQVDPTNAMGSLAEILGPTPAEREAQERRMLDHKAKIAGWTGLIDGLRQLGNIYYTSRGAAPQALSNPQEQIKQNYQLERKRLDELQKNQQNYAMLVHNMKRQAKADELNERRLSRQEKETALRQEKSTAYINYQNSLAEKNEVQAAYWKAKADALEQGLPYDIAVKKATEAQRLASARLANVRADNGGSSQGNYGYEIVEGYNENGEKVKKRIPTSGGGANPGKKRNPMSNDSEEKKNKKINPMK